MMTDSHDLVHDLFLYLGQDLPNALLLANIFLLVFLPSETELNKSLSSQVKRNLEPIRSRCPRLEYLLTKDISSIDDVGNDMSYSKIPWIGAIYYPLKA
jgi:hypothetical protein